MNPTKLELAEHYANYTVVLCKANKSKLYWFGLYIMTSLKAAEQRFLVVPGAMSEYYVSNAWLN